MSISAQDVAKLRQMTGAGMMDAKNALEESEGDFDAASELLRKKGQSKAAKKADRETMQGLVHAYIHPGGRVGVLIEVNCETDFVARNEIFMTLVKDLALHVAAANPLYLSLDQVPTEVVGKEREIVAEQVKEEGKPFEIQAKIIEGKIKKYLEEICLLDQPFVKNPEKTVSQLLHDAISTIGENIQVRRFTRYELAE